jgi:hypothetical protein
MSKALKLPASAANTPLPVSQPLSPPTISGNVISVDQMLANPTIIPPIIRNLAASQRGYFLDRMFSTPGGTVSGGVVIGTPTNPSIEELFLNAGETLAPRAPGTEAPRVGGSRPAPKVFPVESWSGSVEITDEAKRRNDADAVNRILQQVANTFVNILQTRALEVLDAYITEVSRSHANKGDWTTSVEAKASEIKASEAPAFDFAYVQQLLDEDEAGETLKYVILNPAQAMSLAGFYGPDYGTMMATWGLVPIVSPRVTAGVAYFLAEGGVGPLYYEQGLNQETQRLVNRKTTEIVFEVNPVFVPIDAYKVIKLTGLAT